MKTLLLCVCLVLFSSMSKAQASDTAESEQLKLQIENAEFLKQFLKTRDHTMSGLGAKIQEEQDAAVAQLRALTGSNTVNTTVQPAKVVYTNMVSREITRLRNHLEAGEVRTATRTTPSLLKELFPEPKHSCAAIHDLAQRSADSETLATASLALTILVSREWDTLSIQEQRKFGGYAITSADRVDNTDLRTYSPWQRWESIMFAIQPLQSQLAKRLNAIGVNQNSQ
jgi:hypothetical protein